MVLARHQAIAAVFGELGDELVVLLLVEQRRQANLVLHHALPPEHQLERHRSMTPAQCSQKPRSVCSSVRSPTSDEMSPRRRMVFFRRPVAPCCTSSMAILSSSEATPAMPSWD